MRLQLPITQVENKCTPTIKQADYLVKSQNGDTCIRNNTQLCVRLDRPTNNSSLRTAKPGAILSLFVVY